MDHLKRGRLTEAVQAFQDALVLKPTHTEVRHNLGVAFAKLSRLDEAIAQFRKVLEDQPESADACGNLGLACYQAGKHHDALAAYRRLVQLRPNSPDGLQSLANLLRHLEQFDEAVEIYKQILRLKPEAHESWHNLGLAYAQMRKEEDAVASYREALRLKPDFPEVHNNLGILLEEQGKLDEAIACFRKSLKVKPESPETLSNLGVALAGQNKYSEAMSCYYEALRLQPQSAEAHNNLGNALRAEGLVEESIAHHLRALELRPNYAEAFNNLGIAYVQQRNLLQALECYGQAVELKKNYTDAHMNRALGYLAIGDLEKGWQEYEWRWRSRNMQPRPFAKPRWDGSPLGGRTLLLYAEQGLGDTVQFIRYAALIDRQGGRVVFECPRALKPLLKRCSGIDELVVQGEQLPAFDVQLPLLSVPGVLKTRIPSIPAGIPYLHPDPQVLESWRRELASIPERKVGIAWQGSTKYRGDRFRSIPLRHFAPLAKVPGIRLVSLQKGHGVEQLATAGVPNYDLGRPIDEGAGPFMDTAAILKCLDLFVTSDSAIAHLAGALGVNVWLAVPFAPDWRWLDQREDSPWYPTMRIFRQRRRGDWDELFDRMADELSQIATSLFTQQSPSRTEPNRRAERLQTEAVELVKKGHLDAAVGMFRKAIAAQPDFVGAHHNLGVALAKQEKLSEAISCFQKAIQFQPNSCDAHGNLGLAHLQQGELELAERHLQQALKLRHDSPETHNNLGIVRIQQGLPAQAVQSYRAALALKPSYAEAHANLARALLAQGDFEQGWKEYEWRWKCADALPRYLREARWDGSPLEGKTIFLYAEQGLGDTMQFIRFAPLVKAQGCRAVVEAPRHLQALLSRCPGIDEVICHGDTLPRFDAQAPLLSVPGLLHIALDSIPSAIPYLFADPTLEESWKKELGGLSGFKIGIVWQGNPNYSGDKYRSISLSEFAPVAQVPGVRLISLQKGRGLEQLARAGFKVSELDRPIDQGAGAFMDTAAIAQNLDLIITSDTALAHLAGGLGVPVWVALPFASDWRWLRDRDDSPWYPTMRLFRQQRRGDWTEVFQRIATELRKRLGANVPARTAEPSPQRTAAARRLNQEGLHLLKAGKHDDAILRFREALQQSPQLSEVEHNIGVVLAKQGQLDQAIAQFQRVLLVRPKAVETLSNIGLAYYQTGNASQAVAHFEQALALRPDSAENHNNLGVALAQLNRYDEATRHYRRAVECNPEYADAHNNLGNAVRMLGQVEEAARHCRKALELRPNMPEALNNLGIALEEQCQMEEAFASYQQALKVRPDYAEARLNRALCWLAQGKYERGWVEYAWRWKLNGQHARHFREPSWNGAPLEDKTILLYCEQGLGDAIQFVRFAASIKASGGRVLLECPRNLSPLLTSCPGIDHVISQGDALPKFDVQASLLSLPAVLGTRVESVPAEIPYLSANETLVKSWQGELDAVRGFKVGIAWQGSPKYKSDRFRSIPLQQFAPLAKVPQVRLISLQKGPGLDQLSAIDFPVIRLQRPVDEEAGAFMDTAALLKNMDLLITSDSAIAHLAGAMGVPVWLALPFAPDWRWLRQREDSPWYPTMRLFRQARRGDWSELFSRIAKALEEKRQTTGAPTRSDEYRRAIRWVNEGKCEEAIAIMGKMADQHPTSADVWHNLAVAQAKLGRLGDAIANFEKTLKLRPEFVEVYGNLGLAYLQNNRPDDAIPCFRKYLKAKPQSPETYNNLGVALTKVEKSSEAAACFKEAIRQRPEYLDALNNLGNAYRHQDQAGDAIECFRQAIQHHPSAAEVHNNLGITLASQARLDEAVASFHEALRLKPDFPEAFNNLGVTLADSNRIDEALAAFEGALQTKPQHAETHRNRALAWLLQGNYEAGWAEYEWRRKCDHAPAPSFSQPHWDGSPLDGKTVFLHCEQGLGDALQFVRYAPLVKAKVGRVLLQCQKALVPLLSRCQGIDQLIPMGQPIPAFDAYCSLLSLPTIFKTTPATIPASVPYLEAAPELIAYWHKVARSWPGFKVGIAWQGSPKYGGDKNRSIPLKYFAPVAQIDGLTCISLQKGFGTEQMQTLSPRFPLIDLDRQIDVDTGAFMDTAAILKNLDLLVTSDTAVGHLAGGLGVRVWMALCCPCDWRWMRDRSDSPWYPGMRLFRQKRWGDWEAVFGQIAEELRLEVRRHDGRMETQTPVPPGELLDKMTILEIKLERIKDETKLANVRREYDTMAEVRLRRLPTTKALESLSAELKSINEALWEIEDDIRECERARDFGTRFIELARSVYRQNDRRAHLKRKINELLGSNLVEEKSYAAYE